jgi:deoxyribonuclease V
MFACVDVDYRQTSAVAACLVFDDPTAATPSARFVTTISGVQPYQSGEFYRRELPCLLAVLSRVPTPPTTVIIDGYVWTGPQMPGLGAHLHAELGALAAVIGVGKTRLRGAPCVPVLRGRSNSPLYVSAIGLAVAEAASLIVSMSGAFRVPTLLRAVDRLARES